VSVSVMSVMMVRQQVMLDPAPMRDALVGDSTRRSERGGRSDRRADLHQSLVPGVPAGA